MLQKKAIRAINSAGYNAHTELLFKLYHLLKVEDIYKFRLLIFYHNLIYDKAPQRLQNFMPNNSRGVEYYLIRNLRWQPPMHFQTFLARTCSYQLPICYLMTWTQTISWARSLKILIMWACLGLKELSKQFYWIGIQLYVHVVFQIAMSVDRHIQGRQTGGGRGVWCGRNPPPWILERGFNAPDFKRKKV